jgi:hypothetical protein
LGNGLYLDLRGTEMRGQVSRKHTR